MITRRFFMGALAATTTAAGLGFGHALVGRRRLTMSEIGPAVLKPLRHEAITLRGSDGHAIAAVLEEADSVRYPARFSAPPTENVSLVFSVKDSKAGDGTYRVTGPDLDLGNLYLTAVGGTGRDRRLEAIITRIA